MSPFQEQCDYTIHLVYHLGNFFPDDFLLFVFLEIGVCTFFFLPPVVVSVSDNLSVMALAITSNLFVFVFVFVFVTAGGKNVAPAVLEDRLRSHPLVSQCVVVGDARPFIGALITIDQESLKSWVVANKKQGASMADLSVDPQLISVIQTAVDEANKAVSKAESIRKFRILTTDFTIAGGQLTAKLSVKRHVIAKEFASEIEALYEKD